MCRIPGLWQRKRLGMRRARHKKRKRQYRLAAWELKRILRGDAT